MKTKLRTDKRRLIQVHHVYEIRPRKDHLCVDLISDALPFGRLWYAWPNAASAGRFPRGL